MAIKEELIDKRYEKTFFALGTINTITLYGISSREALDAACKRVVEIDDRMSAFKENSDVMKINRNAGINVQRINKDTIEVLKGAHKFSRASRGAFDITIRPLTELWGFGTKQNYIPEREEIERILPLVDYEDLLLDENRCTAYLRKIGQSIDLGGIAKGYAADEVKEILLQYEIESALINLGGNIVTIGNNPSGAPFRIGIQDPMSVRGKYIGTIAVSDKTVVTSGSNEQFFVKDGIRYHHIIDPRTGYPAQNELLSVTAVCDYSIDADALTTAIFVQGIKESMPLLKRLDAEAVFVMQNGDILATEGLSGNFERC